MLAVVLGAWCLVKIERWVRKWMPESLDIVFTPLITMILCLVPYILIIMPATGYVSTALCWVVEKLCMSDILIVRIIAGYISTALFLPMVAMGMHHGLVALYSVQLESFGYVTLYPALAMAGAGQVGAAVAIYFKAKKCGNTRLKNVITGRSCAAKYKIARRPILIAALIFLLCLFIVLKNAAVHKTQT